MKRQVLCCDDCAPNLVLAEEQITLAFLKSRQRITRDVCEKHAAMLTNTLRGKRKTKKKRSGESKRCPYCSERFTGESAAFTLGQHKRWAHPKEQAAAKKAAAR